MMEGIQIKDLSLGFGQRTLLHGGNMNLRAGELTALVGRNGSGKSTLLRTIAALAQPLGGEIKICGEAIDSLSPEAVAQRLAFVTTEKIRISNMTCREVVSLGRSPYTNWWGRLLPADEELIDKAIESVGLHDFKHKSIDSLSDGECQRAMIARALAQDTPIIILDEPTAFLDMPNRYELCALLRNLAHQQNKCILFSTHDLDIATGMCDGIAIIDSGAIHYTAAGEATNNSLMEQLFSNSNLTMEFKEGRWGVKFR